MTVVAMHAPAAPFEVAAPGDAARLFDTLTLAFAADPAARAMFPGARQHQDWFPRFAEGFGGAAFAAGTAFIDPLCRGGALWLPPAVAPDDTLIGRVVDTGVAPPDRPVLSNLFAAMARRHPDFPHWYLALIGVDPAWQGDGIGAVLMQAGLARCDADGLPAYLEASRPDNVPYYRRFGFVALDEIRVEGFPVITPMLRPAITRS